MRESFSGPFGIAARTVRVRVAGSAGRCFRPVLLGGAHTRPESRLPLRRHAVGDRQERRSQA